MHHCIQIFTNNCEVMVQVKRAMHREGDITELPIYDEYMCFC